MADLRLFSGHRCLAASPGKKAQGYLLLWFTTNCGCLCVFGGNWGVVAGGGLSGGGDSAVSRRGASSDARSPLWAELRRDNVLCVGIIGWSSVRGGVRGNVQPPSRRGGRGGGDASRGAGLSRGGNSGGIWSSGKNPVGDEGSHDEVDESRFLRGGSGGGGRRGGRLGGGGGGGWEGGADGVVAGDRAAPMRTGAKTLESLCCT